jgi:ABC-type transporter Mla maintaining outer membrane lipid asymmetry ATPase subunit MlaF
VSAAVRFLHATPPAAFGEWTAALDLEIARGSFTVLSATPTLAGGIARMTCGVLPPESGAVEALGVPLARLGRRELQGFRRRMGVGLVPHGLVSNLPLRSNVIVPLLYSGSAELADAERQADEVLAACGITRWAMLRPADSPPDVRQIAVVARAVVRRPELLVLEDPAFFLDPGRATALLELCRARAGTILVTTHRRESAAHRLADSVHLLEPTGLTTERSPASMVAS